MKRFRFRLSVILLGLFAWQADGFSDDLEEARSALQAQQYQVAETLLRQKLEQHPEMEEARFLFARTLLWQGKFADAGAQYRFLLQTAPDNTDYMLGLAQTYVRDKRPQEALPILEQARKLAPKYADLWRQHIQALAVSEGADLQQQALVLQQEAAKQFPQEDWNIVSADSGKPDTSPAAVRLALQGVLDQARSALQAQQYQTAEQLLRQPLEQYPDFSETRVLFAQALLWQGKYAEAEAQYRSLLKVEPDNTDYMLGLAQTCIRDKRPADALPWLERARQVSPQYVDVWRQHIQALAMLGGKASHQQALALQQEAARRFPQEDWHVVAVAEQITPEAAKAAQEEVSRKLEQARFAMQAQQLQAAEGILRKLLAQRPELAEARFLLARSLLWQGRAGEAGEQYAALLKVEPGNTDYMLGLAQTRVVDKHPLDALPILERARKLTPLYVDLWRLHIQALAAVGGDDYRQQALDLQQEAASRFPQEDWHIVGINDSNDRPALATTKALPDELDRTFDQKRDSQIAVGFSYDHLNKGKAAWHGKFIEFGHSIAPRESVYGALNEIERFGITDYQILAGVYYPLAPHWTINAEANWTPDPQILSRNSGMVSLQRELDGGWNVTGGLRRTEYSENSSTQGSMLLERYMDGFRLAYTLSATHSVNTTTYGHRAQLSRFYNETSYMGLTGSMGEEVDHGGVKDVSYDTRFVGVDGRHWFNQDWALNWNIGHTKQGSAYSKDEVRFGIRRAF